MLSDPLSGHWYECQVFMKRLVHMQTKNIPQDSREEIVQDAMMRVIKALPTFQFQCMLKTWLFGIARSCTIDAYHKRASFEHTSPGPTIASSYEAYDGAENEDDTSPTSTVSILEDECIARDELRKALAVLREYVATHTNPTRNGRILNAVMFEGRSYEEAAKEAGCSAPVAGYVVREAQRYVRKRLGSQEDQQMPKTSKAELHVREGDTLLELGRYSEALESYQEAIRLAPNLSSAYRGQGKTYEQLAQEIFENLKQGAQACYTVASELG